MTSPIMLPKDVAERWRCSERHVRNMINTGQLRGIRLGGKLLRVRLEDVEVYEAAAMTSPTPATTEPQTVKRPA